MAEPVKFVNRRTGENVTAMYYKSIQDFEDLYRFIGDIMPTLTNAHTRVYEKHWIVRHLDNHVEFICCAHNENCFENKYEKRK